MINSISRAKLLLRSPLSPALHTHRSRLASPRCRRPRSCWGPAGPWRAHIRNTCWDPAGHRFSLCKSFMESTAYSFLSPWMLWEPVSWGERFIVPGREHWCETRGWRGERGFPRITAHRKPDVHTRNPSHILFPTQILSRRQHVLLGLCPFCFVCQEARNPVCGPILRIVQRLKPSLLAYALSFSDFSILPVFSWASFLFCNWFSNIFLSLQCSHSGASLSCKKTV